MGDTQKRTHAQLFHLGGGEDFDFQARGAERLGTVGEGFGVEDVGGFIDQITRQMHAFGDGGEACLQLAGGCDFIG